MSCVYSIKLKGLQAGINCETEKISAEKTRLIFLSKVSSDVHKRHWKKNGSETVCLTFAFNCEIVYIFPHFASNQRKKM